MDLFPTDEQEMLVATARDFVTRAVDPRSVRALEASEAGFDLAHWATIVELGWTELEPLELALVADELGRAALPSPLPTTGGLRNALPELAATLPANAIVTLAAIPPGAVNESVGPYPAATRGSPRRISSCRMRAAPTRSSWRRPTDWS